MDIGDMSIVKLSRCLDSLLFVLYDFWGTKCYFGILDNLYVGQKVVLWFDEGQKYQFFSVSCL